jgi:hypothetical protein
MLNDYVEINNGRIINIGFQIDLFIDKTPQSQIYPKLLYVQNI